MRPRRSPGPVHAIAVSMTRGETPGRLVDLVVALDRKLYDAAKLWGPLDGIRLAAALPGWLDGDDLVIDRRAHLMSHRTAGSGGS